MQLPFRKSSRSIPNTPVDPLRPSDDPSFADDAKKDRSRPNTFPFSQPDLPKTDTRSWQSTLCKPAFRSRSLRTSKSVPIDLNKIRSKDKPLPQTPRKTKAEIRVELVAERMKKDQEEFLAACAAAAIRIEAMGGLKEYHDAQVQRKKEERAKRENPEKKFKWGRRKEQ